MIRIDLVLVGTTKKLERTIDALQKELLSRLSSYNPDIKIKCGTTSDLTVSGTKDETEHENIMSIIQAVWEDDTWIPES